MIAIAEINYPCYSPCIIESKSLKLYFNSLNNSKFESIEQVSQIIQRDLAHAIGDSVEINLMLLNETSYLLETRTHFSGTCLDELDVSCDTYLVEPSFLKTNSNQVTETVYSDLLKSNCLVTNQPDWGSVQISYTGQQIDHQGLLKYIVSFRNHNEFHEQCIERIFQDILMHCHPSELTVYGRYTRRGGLDINPFRTTNMATPKDFQTRLVRQ